MEETKSSTLVIALGCEVGQYLNRVNGVLSTLFQTVGYSVNTLSEERSSCLNHPSSIVPSMSGILFRD